MSGTVDHVKSRLKVYYLVGGTLLTLTVVTVAIAYVQLVIPLAVTVALIIAVTKGSLVASYFMHLTQEKRLIYAALVLTVAFFLALMFLPLLGQADHIGTPLHVESPAAGAGHAGH